MKFTLEELLNNIVTYKLAEVCVSIAILKNIIKH